MTRRKVDLSDSATQATRLDRLPPHAPEAEQGVLGCVLLSPNDCLGQCIEKIRDGAAVFYDLRHQTIYTALVTMYDAREAIDIITVQQHLKDRQLLDAIGGISYLNELLDAVPSAANLSYYLDFIIEKYILRRYVQTCTEVVGRIYEWSGEVDALSDSIERDVLHIGQMRESTSQARPYRALVHASIGLIEAAFNREGTISGIATGFTDLDRMTDGMHGGEMIVIAARPSMGKTSLAMNVVEHVGVVQRLPVAVFSMEMSAESLTTRAICSLGRVNMRRIREGFMSERDFPRLTSAAGRMNDAPVYIDDTPGLSVMQLRARARRLHQQYGIRLFVIDYLQLMHSTARKSQENRQQEIADISSGIKALAKELNVPVIVLSQLNRELEKDKTRKPRLADLRESGAIEQDADVVGLLYKPDRNAEESEASQAEEDPEGIPINLLIAKQRNGPTGDVHLTFLKPYTRFESAARVSNDDVPEQRQTMPYPDP